MLQALRRRPKDKDQQALFAQPIGHPRGQRRFGADNHEIDGMIGGKAGDTAGIVDIQLGTGRDLGNPGIAGRDDQLVTFGVLQHSPGQGVFAPAAAKYQDVHIRPFTTGSRCSYPRGGAGNKHAWFHRAGGWARVW